MTHSNSNVLYLNTITLSGRVIAMRHYQDHCDKLVLTLNNAEGSYCIEFTPASSAPPIQEGDQVLIHGSLFSRNREDANGGVFLAQNDGENDD